jgi:phosphoglycerate dehydrogenase-like enzyme
MTTVCLPTGDAVGHVGELPADTTVLVWDGGGEPPEGIEDVEFFVGRYAPTPPSPDVLHRVPRLRVLQLLSAGVDAWLPLVPDGVTVCNGRGVHGASTAELAVAGMVTALRDLPRFADAQREHRWAPAFRDGLVGKRILVVGAGDIGTRIADAVRPFDAVPTLVGRSAREGVQAIDQLAALLPEHDVVVLALPHTPETDHLVDKGFLAAMRDGALLVNVARGAIVDTDALLAELTARRLRAYLDVTDPEPLPAEHALWDAPNLVLTPHVGGGTVGWQQRAYRLVHDQVWRYARGEALINVVR